jgi:hypothetical protein
MGAMEASMKCFFWVMGCGNEELLLQNSLPS